MIHSSYQWTTQRFSTRWPLALGMSLLLGMVSSTRAQVGPDFTNADDPVLLGNIAILPNAPTAGVDAFGIGDDPVLFVEGPIRLNAMVIKQNPASLRVTGNPGLPDLNGTVTVGGQRYKITSRSLVQAVLARNGIDDIRGYQLLWRGEARSLSRSFSQKVGATTYPAVVVGIRGRVQRFSAQDSLSMNFFGKGGLNGRSLHETGIYHIRPGAPGGLFRRESGGRSGFVDMSGTLVAPNPGGGAHAFYVTGMLSIRRQLITLPQNTFLGQDFGGRSYERGSITGRFMGYYDGP